MVDGIGFDTGADAAQASRNGVMAVGFLACGRTNWRKPGLDIDSARVFVFLWVK